MKKKFAPLTFINNFRYLFKYDLKDIYKKVCSLNTFINISAIKANTVKIPKIKNNFETLQELIDTNKSFIRFGDGEYSLIEGNGIPFQEYNYELASKLKEILYNDYENLLTGIPYEHFHPQTGIYNEFTERYMIEYMSKKLDTLCDLLNPDKVYYSSSISQVYPIYFVYDFKRHFEMLRQIWQDKKVVLIVGETVLKNIKYNILDNASEIKIITGPSKNAFDQYKLLTDKIISEANNDVLYIFAIGPAGKIMVFDLYKTGYRAIDLGHTFKDYNAYKLNIAMNKKEIINFFVPD